VLYAKRGALPTRFTAGLMTNAYAAGAGQFLHPLSPGAFSHSRAMLDAGIRQTNNQTHWQIG
jgi:hypothetical protein